jgi:hypothetical protein
MISFEEYWKNHQEVWPDSHKWGIHPSGSHYNSLKEYFKLKQFLISKTSKPLIAINYSEKSSQSPTDYNIPGFEQPKETYINISGMIGPVLYWNEDKTERQYGPNDKRVFDLQDRLANIGPVVLTNNCGYYVRWGRVDISKTYALNQNITDEDVDKFIAIGEL